MKFTERHHAFLVGSFYKVLKERYHEEGVEIFKEATKHYAEQRGHRMALRAKMNGFEKDYTGYFANGEWEATPGEFEVTEELIENGDLITKVYKCPWNDTFSEMGLLDGGVVYCTYIDKHLVKGFNSCLELDVPTVLHNYDHCTFYWRNANKDEAASELINESRMKNRDVNIKDFDFQTGHLHKAFSKVIRDKLNQNAQEIVSEANNYFSARYGEEAIDIILSYQNHDFSDIS